ncbi:MAG TPA: hypothetical protein VME46_14315 [Acidimicrobiales bacterium]|nr:hypothetical protein [Acidimicrobiales bacterium]
MTLAFVQVPDQLTVVLLDPGSGRFGPSSDYVFDCWTPIVGPSTVLLWRRLALVALEAGCGYAVVETPDVFASLGLGASTAKNAIGPRTIARMVGFGLARCQGSRLLGVRAALDFLSCGQVERLSGTARRAHEIAAAMG